MGGRRGSQADADGVEVVERVAPDGQFLAGVAAMALVGNDEVEGVDGDVESVRVLVAGLQFAEGSGRRLSSEQVHGHALDGADVDEGVARLWVEQVLGGQDRGIEALVFVKVLPLEPLAVELVDLVELEGGSGSKLLKARTAWAARARRSTRKSTRRATPDFISR